MIADLLFRAATLVDGTGSPARIADLAVVGGTISQIGDLHETSAHRVIDASGLVLCPGFIDIHTHSDFTLPAYPRAISMTAQGVTTQLAGNCGFSPFPLAGDGNHALQEYSAFLDGGLAWGSWSDAEGYLALIESLPLAANIGFLVGHGSVRMAVMGFDTAVPSPSQLMRMQQLTADAMRAGTFGLSTGLTYAPASSAATDELIALARVAAQFDGAFYSTHLRSEATQFLEALAEAIRVGVEAGLPVQISHFKAVGGTNWSKVAEALQVVKQAVGQGHDVSMDQYPYTAGSTGLAVVLPRWALEGGFDALQRRLADPEQTARIREQIVAQRREDLEQGLREFDPTTIVIASVPPGRLEVFVGLTLEQIAVQRGMPAVDVALDFLREAGSAVLTVIHGQSEDNLREILRHPLTMVASDGWTLDPRAGGAPHPRNYGTFARVLGRYVREEGVLQLEEAVRKMTSLPAERIGLANRGVLRPGAAADLVLFDPATIADVARFEDPHQFSHGVHLVVVNGQIVVEDGVDSGVVAGRVLRRGALAT